MKKLAYGIRIEMDLSRPMSEVGRAVSDGRLFAFCPDGAIHFSIPIRRIPLVNFGFGALSFAKDKPEPGWLMFTTPVALECLKRFTAPAARRVEILLHPEGGETAEFEVERGEKV